MSPEGAVLEPGETGEIAIRSAANVDGYWRDPEATRNAFTDDGFVRTGDLGYLEADGHLFLTDRKKDVINRGGVKFNAADVETIIGVAPDADDAFLPVIEEERAAALAKTNNLFQAQLGQAYAMFGRTTEAREVLRQLELRSQQSFVSPYYLAYVYTGLGEADGPAAKEAKTLADLVPAGRRATAYGVFAAVQGIGALALHREEGMMKPARGVIGFDHDEASRG